MPEYILIPYTSKNPAVDFIIDEWESSLLYNNKVIPTYKKVLSSNSYNVLETFKHALAYRKERYSLHQEMVDFGTEYSIAKFNNPLASEDELPFLPQIPDKCQCKSVIIHKKTHDLKIVDCHMWNEPHCAHEMRLKLIEKGIYAINRRPDKKFVTITFNDMTLAGLEWNKLQSRLDAGKKAKKTTIGRFKDYFLIENKKEHKVYLITEIKTDNDKVTLKNDIHTALPFIWDFDIVDYIPFHWECITRTLDDSITQATGYDKSEPRYKHSHGYFIPFPIDYEKTKQDLEALLLKLQRDAVANMAKIKTVESLLCKAPYDLLSNTELVKFCNAARKLLTDPDWIILTHYNLEELYKAQSIDTD